ncbi:hypothetical protein RF11_01139 [Thelohanellus kitauei]|uniref:Uncharacterized protein n=1 Tax=Thelohanellus kitauei TaxID=669202 RepID=A0A0C2MJ01_THEKT|nr:hypothetical protein RF11_01139 [Thelohanellus kitauei]
MKIGLIFLVLVFVKTISLILEQSSDLKQKESKIDFLIEVMKCLRREKPDFCSTRPSFDDFPSYVDSLIERGKQMVVINGEVKSGDTGDMYPFLESVVNNHFIRDDEFSLVIKECIRLIMDGIVRSSQRCAVPNVSGRILKHIRAWFQAAKSFLLSSNRNLS